VAVDGGGGGQGHHRLLLQGLQGDPGRGEGDLLSRGQSPHILRSSEDCRITLTWTCSGHLLECLEGPWLLEAPGVLEHRLRSLERRLRILERLLRILEPRLRILERLLLYSLYTLVIESKLLLLRLLLLRLLLSGKSVCCCTEPSGSWLL